MSVLINILWDKRAKKTKSLGVIVDEGLNWEQHFKAVEGKVRGSLSSLEKLKNLVPQKQLDNVYRALTESPFAVRKCYVGQYS